MRQRREPQQNANPKVSTPFQRPPGTIARPSSSSKLWRVLFFALIGLAVIMATMTSKAIRSENIMNGIAHLPVIRDVAQWTTGIQNTVRGDDGRINVLLLGMPGKGHDGFLLTDTIIFASYDPKSDHVALVSIPRDLFVPIPTMGMRKINEANAYGEQNKYPGGGGALAVKTVEEVFDQNIDYFLRIDFSGFERIIDLLGGIDVYVERSFVDNQYPTEDFLTKTIQFEQGMQHMNGTTALEFARSRHGSNGEGSDFARAARQQKILSAVKSKVLSLNLLLNPKKIASLVREVSDNIQTNVDPWDIGDLLSVANSTKGENITNIVLNDAPGGYLVSQHSPETGFILVPRDGNFHTIQTLIQNIHLGGKIETEAARVYLLNGTGAPGLARVQEKELTQWNVHVVGTGNAPEQQYEKTVIYDLSNGKKDTTLKFLKQTYSANVSKKIPELLLTTNDENIQRATNPELTELLVVLGNDVK